jgi:hypothetical protein
MPKSVIAGLAALVSGLVLAVTPLAAQAQEHTLNQSENTQNKIVKEAASTQKKIDSLSSQTQKMLSEYLSTKQQIDQMKRYNSNLAGLVNDQTSRVASLNNQLEHVADVEHGIVPLMEQMISGLENFIKLDMPFHRKDRMADAQKLEDLMTNSDVTISEKYRQIMAAYQTELDYGKTVDAYRANLKVNGKSQQVQFLRIGRVSLCYQTLNQSQTGCWNADKDKWVVNDGYRRHVTNALSVARKQTTPSLLILPVLAPQQPLSVPKAVQGLQQPTMPATTAPAMQTSAAPQSSPAPQSKS